MRGHSAQRACTDTGHARCGRPANMRPERPIPSGGWAEADRAQLSPRASAGAAGAWLRPARRHVLGLGLTLTLTLTLTRSAPCVLAQPWRALVWTEARTAPGRRAGRHVALAAGQVLVAAHHVVGRGQDDAPHAVPARRKEHVEGVRHRAGRVLPARVRVPNEGQGWDCSRGQG